MRIEKGTKWCTEEGRVQDFHDMLFAQQQYTPCSRLSSLELHLWKETWHPCLPPQSLTDLKLSL